MTRIDSAWATPAYPRLTWERDTEKWVLLNNGLLRQHAGHSWDTVAQLADGATYERGFQRGGRLYALRYDRGNHRMDILYSDSTGAAWTPASLPSVRDFAVFDGKWFKISYAGSNESKIYVSSDLGASWLLVQPDGWTKSDVFQVHRDQLYVTTYVPALQGRRIARWKAQDNAWEIIGNTSGGGDCNAWLADGGFYLLQNTNHPTIWLGTCYGDLERKLEVPFSYSVLYSYNPLLFASIPGAFLYVRWGHRLLANAESGGLWTADLHELLRYQNDIDTAVCAGQSVTVGDTLVQIAGDYPVVTAVSALGLDSITVLHLAVWPAFSVEIDTFMAHGQVFQNWTVTQDSVFTQTYQTVNGCDSTRTIRVHALTSATGEDVPGLSRIGPNPFTGSITLFAGAAGEGEVRLRLLDALGRLRWTATPTLQAGVNTFEVDLPAGPYWLLIETERHRAARYLFRGR